MRPWLHWALLALLPFYFLLAGCTPTQQAQELYTRVMTVSTADLDQAYDLASYNNDKPAMQCWDNIRQFVKGVQARPQVTIGGATALQVFMDLTSPQSQVNVACAAYKAAVKERVQSLVGQAATFAASIGL